MLPKILHEVWSNAQSSVWPQLCSDAGACFKTWYYVPCVLIWLILSYFNYAWLYISCIINVYVLPSCTALTPTGVDLLNQFVQAYKQALLSQQTTAQHSKSFFQLLVQCVYQAATCYMLLRNPLAVLAPHCKIFHCVFLITWIEMAPGCQSNK